MNIGFLGGGQMAEAIIKGLCNNYNKESLEFAAYDINKLRIDYLADTYGVKGVLSNNQVIADSDVIFIAVKPQFFPDIANELKVASFEGKILVTMMAGVSISSVQDVVGSSCKIARIMPNTPVGINEGTVLVSCNGLLSADDKLMLMDLFNSLGLAMELPEKLIDAGTGISGCGPAYFYLILEGMMAGGIEAGLTADIALKLAASTMKGSAAMVLETKEHPAVLKDKVTSPGGSTIAGVAAMEEFSVRAGMINAVRAGYQKSKELGGGNKVSG